MKEKKTNNKLAQSFSEETRKIYGSLAPDKGEFLNNLNKMMSPSLVSFLDTPEIKDQIFPKKNIQKVDGSRALTLTNQEISLFGLDILVYPRIDQTTGNITVTDVKIVEVLNNEESFLFPTDGKKRSEIIFENNVASDVLTELSSKLSEISFFLKIDNIVKKADNKKADNSNDAATKEATNEIVGLLGLYLVGGVLRQESVDLNNPEVKKKILEHLIYAAYLKGDGKTSAEEYLVDIIEGMPGFFESSDIEDMLMSYPEEEHKTNEVGQRNNSDENAVRKILSEVNKGYEKAVIDDNFARGRDLAIRLNIIRNDLYDDEALLVSIALTWKQCADKIGAKIGFLSHSGIVEDDKIKLLLGDFLKSFSGKIDNTNSTLISSAENNVEIRNIVLGTVVIPVIVDQDGKINGLPEEGTLPVVRFQVSLHHKIANPFPNKNIEAPNYIHPAYIATRGIIKSLTFPKKYKTSYGVALNALKIAIQDVLSRGMSFDKINVQNALNGAATDLTKEEELLRESLLKREAAFSGLMNNNGSINTNIGKTLFDVLNLAVELEEVTLLQEQEQKKERTAAEYKKQIIEKNPKKSFLNNTVVVASPALIKAFWKTAVEFQEVISTEEIMDALNPDALNISDSSEQFRALFSKNYLGGRSADLKNDDGTLKFTKVASFSELMPIDIIAQIIDERRGSDAFEIQSRSDKPAWQVANEIIENHQHQQNQKNLENVKVAEEKNNFTNSEYEEEENEVVSEQKKEEESKVVSVGLYEKAAIKTSFSLIGAVNSAIKKYKTQNSSYNVTKEELLNALDGRRATNEISIEAAGLRGHFSKAYSKTGRSDEFLNNGTLEDKKIKIIGLSTGFTPLQIVEAAIRNGDVNLNPDIPGNEVNNPQAKGFSNFLSKAK